MDFFGSMVMVQTQASVAASTNVSAKVRVSKGMYLKLFVGKTEVKHVPKGISRAIEHYT